MINLYQYKNQLDYWYDERKNIKFPFYKKSYIKTFHSTKKSTPARHPYKKHQGCYKKHLLTQVYKKGENLRENV